VTTSPFVSRIRTTTLSVVALSAAALSLGARTASAGTVSPQLAVGVTVTGDSPQSVTSTSGSQVPGTDTYYYTGSIASSVGDWFVNWSLNGSNIVSNPNGPFITTDLVVGNTSDTTRTFSILVSLETSVQAPTGGNYFFWNTLLNGSLRSNDGGVASLVGLTPAMLQCQINGTGVSNNNPQVASTTTTSQIGPSANYYSGPIPNGPNVNNIGYLMSFSLSAHSTAVFSGHWQSLLVPAPSAIALIGVAGFASSRRRK
jgi:hypothetical protein